VIQDFLEAGPRLLEGAGFTLLFTVVGAIAAIIISFVFGFMALSGSVLVRGFARVIVEFFRGTSLVIQLLWLAFVLPQLGIRLELWVAAVVALGFNFGAYGSEVVRGALNAVPKAQWEATVALGLGRVHRMRRVILPQALPEMIPPFGNLWIQILKSSSLLFLISITDLTFQFQDLRYTVGSLASFSLALVVYFLIAQMLVAVTRVVENNASRRLGRRPSKKVRTPQAVAST
jgi:polar amino acid transport system permease protein